MVVMKPTFLTIAIAISLAGPISLAGGNESQPDRIAGQSLSECADNLNSDTRIVRLRAIRTLGAFGKPAAKTLTGALSHDDDAVRFIAATHLGRLGGESLDRAIPQLMRLASSSTKAGEDPQPESVQMAAAYALCEAGKIENYLPVLIRFVKDPRRGHSCYASDLIGRLGPPAAAATATLEATYQSNRPDLRNGDYHIGAAARNALRKVTGDEK